MWGLSIHVWRKSNIDYIRLLQLSELPLFREDKSLPYYSASFYASSFSSSSTVTVKETPDVIIFGHTSSLSIIYFILFILYTRSVRYATLQQSSLTYAHTLPLLLIIIFLYYIIYPWKKSKKIWYDMLKYVLCAPCYPISFRDGFIGDILTSLVRVLVPLFSSCIYIIMVILAYLTNDFTYLSSNNNNQPFEWWETTSVYKYYLVPFLTLYPLYIRLMQCLRRSVESGDSYPHHYNALKYASAITVISFGTFQPTLRRNTIWILCLILTTLYQLYWDIVMDWGLLTWNKQRKYYNSNTGAYTTTTTTHNNECSQYCIKLRPSRLLSQKPWYYYNILIFNIFFRFAWTLTLLSYMYDYDTSTNTSTTTTTTTTTLNLNELMSSVVGKDMVLKPTLLQVVISHTGPLIASAEIIRRMIWAWLRLEFEHIEVLGSAMSNSNNGNNNNSNNKLNAATDDTNKSQTDTTNRTHNNNNNNNNVTSKHSKFNNNKNTTNTNTNTNTQNNTHNKNSSEDSDSSVHSLDKVC